MIVDVNESLLVPYWPCFNTNAPTFGTKFVDASTEKFAFIGQVPKTGTLDKFEINVRTTVFLATSVLRLSFQNVSMTTGDPDGTQDQFRDVTSVSSNSWIVPGVMTDDGTDGGVKRSVTQGDLIALVAEYQNFLATDSIQFATITQASDSATLLNFGYNSLFTGTWAKSRDIVCAALKYSDGTYEHLQGLWPVLTLASNAFSSSSTPDERGMKFRFPVPVRVSGYWWRGNFTAGATCTITLYDASNNVLTSHVIDTDQQDTPASNFFRHGVLPDAVELSANTDYRLTVKPDANQAVISDFTVNASALMGAAPGGVDWIGTTRSDAGAWTDTNTVRPWMGLLIDGISSVGAGGWGALLGHTRNRLVRAA